MSKPWSERRDVTPEIEARLAARKAAWRKNRGAPPPDVQVFIPKCHVCKKTDRTPGAQQGTWLHDKTTKLWRHAACSPS